MSTRTLRRAVYRFEPETIAYKTRITDALGTIAAASLRAVNQFVVECKAANVWDSLVDVGVFAGTALTAALVKLKYPEGVAGLFTNNNFLSGDYTEATGLNGNGTTKYLASGANLVDHADDGKGALCVYTRAAAPAGTAVPCGAKGNSGIGAKIITTDEELFTEWGTLEGPAFGTGAAGFYAAVGGATEGAAYYNGQLVTPGDALPSDQGQEVYLFALNDDDAAESFWTGRISFYAMALPLTEADVAALYAAVQRLQLALGRNV